MPRIGLGWYWISPIAFVDTSDMWLASRWQRIAVAVAGPYTQAILSGVAALIGWMSSNPQIAAMGWLFASMGYVVVLVNLCPLLEYDGYYVLMDWLDRPNLRSQSIAWFKGHFAEALRTPHGLRDHRRELTYVLASVIYASVMTILT